MNAEGELAIKIHLTMALREDSLGSTHYEKGTFCWLESFTQLLKDQQ